MAGRFSLDAVFRAVDRVTQPVSRMQRRVGRFTMSMERGLRRVDRVAGRVTRALRTGMRRSVIGVGVVVAGLALQLNSLAKESDALAKQTRRLDFPIEQFQEWRFAAEQSGVTSELFSKSLDAFSKRLGEARAGTGQMKTLLERVNPVLFRQLMITENSAEALEIFIEGLRNARSPMERDAMAAAAFSRQGLKMGNIALQSADAIAALRREQRENGNITLEQAMAAEAYNDAINSLGRSLTGLKANALTPLMAQLTPLIERARAWTIANREMVSSRVLGFFRSVRENFGRITTWLVRIGIGIGVWFAFIALLKTFIVVMTAVNLVMALNPIGLIVLGVLALTAAVAAAVVWWDEIVAVFREVNPLLFHGAVAIAALFGPVGWLIGAGLLIVRHWDGVKEFLGAIWEFLVNVFRVGVGKVAGFLEGRGLGPDVLMEKWEAVKSFFVRLWEGIEETFRAGVDRVMALVDRVRLPDLAGAVRSVTGFFSGDDDDEVNEGVVPERQVVSPQARNARSIEERRTTDQAEVVIRDETGRAEVTRGPRGRTRLQLEPTGAF